MRWILALLTRGLAALAAVVRAVLSTGTVPTPVNRPPRVQIRNPAGGAMSIPIAVEFDLFDDESDPVTVEATFSSDGGATFRAASAVGSPPGGMTGLPSSPTGTAHVFRWDAARDLGPGTHAQLLLELTPRDAVVGSAARSAAFSVQVVSPGSPPAVQILSPAGSAQPIGPVPVRYLAFDREADPVALSVRYSTDGSNWTDAREAPAGSEGLTGLTTSTAGEPHVFVWDAGVDLPNGAAGVLLEITPRDATVGTTARSQPFDLTPPTPPPPVGAPSVTVFAPLDETGPLVPLTVFVSHPDSQLVDLVLEHGSGGAFAPATLGPESDAIANVPASRHGVLYQLVWDAARDRGVDVRSSAQLRVTARQGGASGAPATTPSFRIDTRALAPLPVNAPRTVMPVGLAIARGDQQQGVAGQLLPQPLMVRVTSPDAWGVQNVAVDFHVEAGPGLAEADIEGTWQHRWPITQFDGVTAVRVRPRRGTSGTLRVRASVVGVPSASVTFTAAVSAPQILPMATNPAVLAYGTEHFLYFTYGRDADPSTVDFEIDPQRPIRLVAEATNADVHAREQHGTYGRMWVKVMPRVRTGTVALRIYDRDEPTIEYTASLPVVTPPNAQRLVRRNPVDRRPVRLSLEVVRGFDPVTNAAQKAHPGLTLSEPFRVRIRDEDAPAQAYVSEVTGGEVGCPAPTLRPIQVVWRTTGGVLATSTTAAGVPTLRAEIGTPVYFTPDQPGPWTLTGGVESAQTSALYLNDPFAVPFLDASGQCEHRESGLRLDRFALYYTFVIEAETARLEHVRTGTVVEEPRPGDRVRAVIDGLSAFEPNPRPRDVWLKAKPWSGMGFPPHGGLPAPFDRRLPMQPTTPGRLESDPLLLVSGDPLLPANPPSLLSVLPRGWLVIDHNGGLPRTLPVAGVARSRLSPAGEPTPLEAAVGSTPSAGFQRTIQLHSGELVRTIVDLSFRTGGGEFLLARTYRSQLDGEGVLGPGWIFDFETRFERGDMGGGTYEIARLTDASGGVRDLMYAQPSFANAGLAKGLFMDVVTHPDTGSDRGAYELVSCHGRRVHYNIDGSLRLIRERSGDITRFHYDERARLVEIEDALERKVKLEYYTEQDTSVPEVLGKLKAIESFDGRRVTYAYYANDTDPRGRKGWLKEVVYPAAPRWVGASLDPDYATTERYVYFKLTGALAAVDGALKEIRDREDDEILTNWYTATRRVERQEWEGDRWLVRYPSAGKTVTMDPEGNQRTWEFPQSPFVAAAAPSKLTEDANRAVRPNGADVVTEMEHNVDGLPVRVQLPGGGRIECVYPDPRVTAPRSHANLLVYREVGAGGGVREWSWTYEARFNQVTRAVPPEGNGTTGIPERYATKRTYDSEGNLTEVVEPWLASAVTVEGPAGADQRVWLAERPTTRIQYNAHNRPVRVEDARGVVTRYEYYPKAQPTGGAASSETAEGLLARVTEDAEDTARRTQLFAGQPPAQRATLCAYTDVGDPERVTDPRGGVHRLETDALRAQTGFVLAESATATGVTPTGAVEEKVGYRKDRLPIKWEQRERGRTRFSLDVKQGPAGRTKEYEEDRGAAGKLRLKRDRTRPGRVLVSGPAKESGKDPDEVFEIVEDERRLPFTVERAPGANPTPRVLELQFTPDGQLTLVSQPGTGRVTIQHGDSSDYQIIVDPSGREVVGLLDRSGKTVRTYLRVPAAAGAPEIWAFEEVVVDARGLVQRVHKGRLALVTPPMTGVPIPPAVEAFRGFGGMAPPPPPRSALEDLGLWGPRDGRATIDFLRDPMGRPSRLVNDGDRAFWVRRDPDGNVLSVWDGKDRLRLGRQNGLVSSARLELAPVDPADAPMVLLRSVERDDSFRPIRIVDGWGNATDLEYRQTDRTIVVYDSMGPDSVDVFNGRPVNARGNQTRLRFDGAYRLENVEIDLTQGGIGGAPAEANPHNQRARLSTSIRYVGDRLDAVLDADGREYVFLYDEGRFGGMRYPQSAAAPNGCDAVVGRERGTGRVLTSRDANGTLFTLTYDPVRPNLIRRVEVTAPVIGVEGTRGYAFGYDEAGRLKSAYDVTTHRGIGFDLDSDGCALIQDQGSRQVAPGWAGPMVTSEYYRGLRRRLSYPDGSSFDFRHREGEVVIESGSSLEARYDVYGAFARNAFHRRQYGPLTMRVWYRPDVAVRKIDFEGIQGGAVIRFDAQDPSDPTDPNALLLDRQGRFEGWTRTLVQPAAPITESRAWTRDSAGRILTQVDRRARRPDRIETERVFDGFGVRREQTVSRYDGTQLVSYLRVTREGEERGRVLEEKVYDSPSSTTPVMHHRFTYDRVGNLLSDGTYEYRYDAFGRLVWVKDRRFDNVTRFEWDALGRRTHAHYEWVDPPFQFSERYVYDGGSLIQVRIEDVVVEEYVWGRLQGELLWVGIRRGTTSRFWATQRPDGSVDSLVASDGRIVESYDYSLDGEQALLDGRRLTAVSSNSVRGLPHGPMQRVGFLGQVHDPYTELVFCGSGRVYNPRLGLFLTPDPEAIGALESAYGLAGGDPIGAGNALMLGTIPQPEGGDNGDWGWGAMILGGVVAFACVVTLGVLAIGAMAVLVGAGLLSTGGAVVAGGTGLAIAWGTATYLRNQRSGEGLGGAALGGLLDATGVSGVWQGVALEDPTSGADLYMTDWERGSAVGGGVGSLLLLGGGGRVFNRGQALGRGWGHRVRCARDPEGMALLRAQANVLRGWARTAMKDSEIEVSSVREGLWLLRHTLRRSGEAAEFGLYENVETGRVVVRRGTADSVAKPKPGEYVIAHTHPADPIDGLGRYVLPAPQDLAIVLFGPHREKSLILARQGGRTFAEGGRTVTTQYGFRGGKVYIDTPSGALPDEFAAMLRANGWGETRPNGRMIFDDCAVYNGQKGYDSSGNWYYEVRATDYPSAFFWDRPEVLLRDKPQFTDVIFDGSFFEGR